MFSESSIIHLAFAFPLALLYLHLAILDQTTVGLQ